MLTKKEKQQALDYTAHLLECSDGYAILRQQEQGLMVQEKHADSEDTPKTIAVVLANALPAAHLFSTIHESNCRDGIYTAHLFYKDGKTAFVRMVDRNISWRAEKSLKGYSRQEINQMLHLRGIEHAVRGNCGDTRLAYYQPPTAHLEESIRVFDLEAVQLDYSHVDRDHPSYGFVQNRESIDYKLPREKEVIRDAALLVVAEVPDRYLRAWLADLRL